MGRELRRRFGAIFSGQWIEFHDYNGRGFAQPDHFLVLPDVVIVFECKLSQQESGLIQIGELYRPLLQKIYGKRVVGILVCKVLRRESKWLIDDPSLVFDHAKEDIFTWHWIG